MSIGDYMTFFIKYLKKENRQQIKFVNEPADPCLHHLK